MTNVYKSIIAIENPEVGYTLYTKHYDDTLDGSTFRSDVWFEVAPEELEAMIRTKRVVELDKGRYAAV